MLTGLERHRRWREKGRQEILAAPFAPGASVSEVPRRHDVAASLVYKWRQQVALLNEGYRAQTLARVAENAR